MNPVMRWLQAKLADTQLMMLFVSLLAIFVLLSLFGDVLAPLLVAIALAYVMESGIDFLERCKLPRFIGIGIVGAGALLMVLFALFTLLPLLSGQLGRLIGQVPEYVKSTRGFLETLQHDYSGWLNPDYLQQLVATLASKLQGWGADLLSFSLSSIPGVITLLVYAVLVPVLVFFLLKDKKLLINWGKGLLPSDHLLLNRVWKEVDIQIGNYIRGKFIETLIVGVAMWVAYVVLGHEYALLLAVLTGVSVWVPFIGAAVVTVPVVLLSLFQWGWSDATLYSLIAYAVIQTLDANVVIPWLFSEVVNLHPIAIIMAVLIFGSLWGLVGVFVAIPMASLVKSVLTIVAERKDMISEAG